MDGTGETVYIGLGGNVGDVPRTIDQALARLATAAGDVVRCSDLLATPAVGERAGAPFRNGVVELVTSLAPSELLTQLQRIEDDLGRVRGVRWGPRSLDLDILFYGQSVLHTETLQVPHPRCWYRRFVLDPLCEIASDLWHPVMERTIVELRNRLLPRPLIVELAGGDARQQASLAGQMADRFSQVRIAPWDGTPDPNLALLVWLGESPEMTQDDLPPLPTLDLTAEPGDPDAALHAVLVAAGLEPG